MAYTNRVCVTVSLQTACTQPARRRLLLHRFQSRNTWRILKTRFLIRPSTLQLALTGSGLTRPPLLSSPLPCSFLPTIALRLATTNTLCRKKTAPSMPSYFFPGKKIWSTIRVILLRTDETSDWSTRRWRHRQCARMRVSYRHRQYAEWRQVIEH